LQILSCFIQFLINSHGYEPVVASGRGGHQRVFFHFTDKKEKTLTPGSKFEVAEGEDVDVDEGVDG
jgi:hypothetical protein